MQSASQVQAFPHGGNAAMPAHTLDNLLVRLGQLNQLHAMYQIRTNVSSTREGAELRLKEIKAEIDKLTLDIIKEEAKLVGGPALDSLIPVANVDNSASTSTSSAASTSIPVAVIAPVDSSSSENISAPVASLAPVDNSTSANPSIPVAALTPAVAFAVTAPGGAFVPPDPEDATSTFTPTPSAPSAPPELDGNAGAAGNSASASSAPGASSNSGNARVKELRDDPFWEENSVAARGAQMMADAARVRAQAAPAAGTAAHAEHKHNHEAKDAEPANTKLSLDSIWAITHLLQTQLNKHAPKGIFGNLGLGDAAPLHNLLDTLKRICELAKIVLAVQWDAQKRYKGMGIGSVVYNNVATEMHALKIINANNQAATEREVSPGGKISAYTLMPLIETFIQQQIAVFKAGHKDRKIAAVYAFMRRALALLPYIDTSPDPKRPEEVALRRLEELAALLQQPDIYLPKTDAEMRFIADNLNKVIPHVKSVAAANQNKEITQEQFDTLLKLMPMRIPLCDSIDGVTKTLAPYFRRLKAANIDNVFCYQTLVDFSRNESCIKSYTQAFVTLKRSPSLFGNEALLQSLIGFEDRAHHYAETITALRPSHDEYIAVNAESFPADALHELCLMLSEPIIPYEFTEVFAAIKAGLVKLQQNGILSVAVLKSLTQIPWAEESIRPHLLEVFTGVVNDLCSLAQSGIIHETLPLLEKYIFPRYSQYAYLDRDEVRNRGHHYHHRAERKVASLRLLDELTKLVQSEAYGHPAVKAALIKILEVPAQPADLNANVCLIAPPYFFLTILTNQIIKLHTSGIDALANLNLETLIDHLIATPGRSDGIVNTWIALYNAGILDKESSAYAAANLGKAYDWVTAVKSLDEQSPEYAANLAFLRRHRDEARDYNHGLITLTQAGYSGDVIRKTMNRVGCANFEKLRIETEKEAKASAAVPVVAGSLAALQHNVASTQAAAHAESSASQASAVSLAASSSSLSSADAASSGVLSSSQSMFASSTSESSVSSSSPAIQSSSALATASPATRSKSASSLSPEEVEAARATFRELRKKHDTHASSATVAPPSTSTLVPTLVMNS